MSAMIALLATTWAVDVAAQRVAYRDGDGIWQWTEGETVRRFVTKAESAPVTVADTFTLTYQDLSEATGVGFDDPISGSVRRKTLHDVLTYLASVLDFAGTADLLIVASQIDGMGAVASGGPYVLPRMGFQGGLVYEHLTTGTDPRPDVLDGTLVVDFGYTWNSDTDAASRIEFDLFTALLHEVTHALGFFSAVGSDGRSQLLNVGDTGVFSLADSFLERASENRRLYLAAGLINATPEDVTSRDLVFAGSHAEMAFAAFPPIFAPSPFIDGSSISHWDPAAGGDAVLLPDLRRGDQRRQLMPWELQVLVDLGYALVVCGDGVQARAEECDDGNLDNQDGCDAQCKIEIPIPDAGVPDADVPDADVPDATIEDGGTDPDAEPPVPILNSSQAGGCNAGGAGTGGAWGGLWLLLLATRHRVPGRGSKRPK
jgi:cysteine-rich repeat protein